jgi:hypothetical protein
MDYVVRGKEIVEIGRVGKHSGCERPHCKEEKPGMSLDETIHERTVPKVLCFTIYVPGGSKSRYFAQCTRTEEVELSIPYGYLSNETASCYGRNGLHREDDHRFFDGGPRGNRKGYRKGATQGR